MIDFLTIVLAIFGVLQIILFFKMWGMTNNVNKIKDKIGSETKEEDYIIDAQINAMNGDKEEAFELYKKAFYLSIIEIKTFIKDNNLYNKDGGEFEGKLICASNKDLILLRDESEYYFYNISVNN